MKKLSIQLLFKTFTFIALAIAISSCCGAKTTDSNSKKPVSGVVTPDWAKNAVIYEINTRQYTPEGTFNALAAHLPRLKALGVDILWFMPIHPIGIVNRKGGLGSYYSIKDYKAVNPEFGNFNDFKNFVSKAQEMGFKVVLDWVANHTAFDHQWVTQHPEWYTRDANGNIVSPFDWTDVADLNFDDNPALWDAMADAMKFWVAEANIDGYRCDVAGMVPTAFWERIRTELNAVKPVFLLAEDEGQRDLMQKAFDANYAWEFHHIMNQIAKGEKNVKNIWAYFAKEDSLFPVSSYRMMFTSNHDENSWNGTEFERLGAGAKAFAVMSYLVPGFPLIYNGQEVALDHRLLFFEKDLIPWNKETDFTSFYQTLNRLKKENEALWNANHGGTFEAVETDKHAEVLSFYRVKNNNKLIGFINLTPVIQEVKIYDKNIYGTYIDQFTEKKILVSEAEKLLIPAWGYYLLK